jgi:hypothetical protein
VRRHGDGGLCRNGAPAAGPFIGPIACSSPGRLAARKTPPCVCPVSRAEVSAGKGGEEPHVGVRLHPAGTSSTFTAGGPVRSLTSTAEAGRWLGWEENARAELHAPEEFGPRSGIFSPHLATCCRE